MHHLWGNHIDHAISDYTSVPRGQRAAITGVPLPPTQRRSVAQTNEWVPCCPLGPSGSSSNPDWTAIYTVMVAQAVLGQATISEVPDSELGSSLLVKERSRASACGQQRCIGRGFVHIWVLVNTNKVKIGSPDHFEDRRQA